MDNSEFNAGNTGAQSCAPPCKKKARLPQVDPHKMEGKPHLSSEVERPCRRPQHRIHTSPVVHGILISLSHIVQRSTAKMFFAQFLLDEGSENPPSTHHKSGREGAAIHADPCCVTVMVMIHHTLNSWRDNLKLGAHYALHKLSSLMILKSRVGIMKALPTSRLVRLDEGILPAQEDDQSRAGCSRQALDQSRAAAAAAVSKYRQEKGWITYRGVVHKAINSNLGLYLLDGGKAILVMTALLGACDELAPPSDPCGGQTEGLEEGAVVVVMRPHVARLPSGALMLACCGRSHVHVLRKDRPPCPGAMPSASLQAVADHALHGCLQLLWLSDVELQMCRLLRKLGISERAIKCHAAAGGAQQSPLSRLLQCWRSRSPHATAAPRCLVEDFCLPHHQLCPVTRCLYQKFTAPFEIFDSKALEEKAQEDLLLRGIILTDDDCVPKVESWRAFVTTLVDPSFETPVSVTSSNSSTGVVGDCSAEHSADRKCDSTDDVSTVGKNACNSVGDCSLSKVNNNSVVQNAVDNWTSEGVMLCRLDTTKTGDLIAVFDGVHIESTADGCEDSYSGGESSKGGSHKKRTSDGRFSYKVEFFGSNSGCPSKMIGKIVALFNPMLITELFHVNVDAFRQFCGKKSVLKQYLMVHVSNVYVIYDSPLENIQPSDLEASGVSSKSCQLSQDIKSSSLERESQLSSSMVPSTLPAVISRKIYGNCVFELEIFCKLNKVLLVNSLNEKFSIKNILFLLKCKIISGKNAIHAYCSSRFSQKTLDCLEVAYFRLKGSLQHGISVLLPDPCKALVEVPLSSDAITVSTGYPWLPTPFCNEQVIVDIPERASISLISRSDPKGEFSVSEVLEANLSKGLCSSVVGVVKERYLMAPSFGSEKIHISDDNDANDVGVPGCQLIRLTLQDNVDDPTAKRICVYISLKNKWVIGRYPQGLVKGALVKIANVTYNKSVTTNTVYLSASPVSFIKVLALPKCVAPRYSATEAGGTERNPRITLLRFLKRTCGACVEGSDSALSMIQSFGARGNFKSDELLSSIQSALSSNGHCIQVKAVNVSRLSPDNFRVIARVTKLMKVNLSLECSTCKCKISNISGSCVNKRCISTAVPVLTCFADVVVEDGFCSAHVIITTTALVRTLLALSNLEWRNFVKTIVDYRMPITNVPPQSCSANSVRESDDGDSGEKSPPVDRLSVSQVLTKALQVYCSCSKVYRPYLLRLRPLEPDEDFGALQLQEPYFYCLDLTNVTPTGV